MRPVRPTARVLRALPVRMVADQATRQRLEQLDGALLASLNSLEHPIINAARSQVFEGHRCQNHRAATKAAKRKVFEIEEPSTGWRGAVVLDEGGDPWLVYVDEHDSFHRKAKDVLKAEQEQTWWPSKSDYTMRDREDLLEQSRAWRGAVVHILLRLLQGAVESGGRQQSQLPRLVDGACSVPFTVDLSLDHDPLDASTTALDVHASQSTVDLAFRIRQAPQGEERDFMFRAVARLFGVAAAHEGIVYLPDDQGMAFYLVVTKADLVALYDLARVSAGETGQLDAYDPQSEPVEPTHRHFVREAFMTDALIEGDSMRAVCGVWFVPTQDAEGAATLPLCLACDERRPLAQTVLNFIRAQID